MYKHAHIWTDMYDTGVTRWQVGIHCFIVYLHTAHVRCVCVHVYLVLIETIVVAAYQSLIDPGWMAD